MAIEVQAVSEGDVQRVQAFLRAHSETSMFLASNLATYGPVLTDEFNSGNFKLLLEDGRVQGVFCLARRGNVLAECGGRTEFAPVIVEACRREPLQIRGVVGEWQLADAIWQILLDAGDIEKVLLASRERLYRLMLGGVDVPRPDSSVRLLRASEFDAWQPLHTAFLQEEGLPIEGSDDHRRRNYAERAEAGFCWGLWQADRLLAIGGLNALHERTGQIGGVYTLPEKRRSGLATQLMESLIADCAGSRGLERLILFTGEHNIAAQRLYESLGFEPIGEFALLFGAR